MNILWLNWKDHLHPNAGGAEVVLWELSRRLVGDGHNVTLLTCGYPDSTSRDHIDGVDIIRVGNNRYAHSLQALIHYVRHLRNVFDVVIEVVNTAPYFGVFFGKRSRRFLLYHQLAEVIWHYETKPPLSYLGRYVLEPLATRFLSRAAVPTITISESTRRNLTERGFHTDAVHIISEGIQFEPIENLENTKKYKKPTMLSLGAIRAMKRTKDQIVAFEIAKAAIPDLRLKIAGAAEGAYGKAVLEYIQRSPYAADIEYLGKVSHREKLALMQRSHLITVTSVKEGWGLIVTEAASQGTPAVVYNVDGLRDSVRHNETGIITKDSPAALARGITQMLLDQVLYQTLRESGWNWSKAITFDNSYRDFKTVLELP